MRSIKVSVDPSFLLLLFLLFWKSPPRELLLFFGAVLLHEAGHFAALCCCKAYPKKLILSLTGANLVTSAPFLPYRKEILVYLAGPAAGMAGCAGSFFLLRWRFTQGTMLFFSFSLLLTLLNLIPVKGLDGSCALKAFLCLRGEENRAEEITDLLHGVSLFLLLALSLFLWRAQENPSLFFLALSLFGENLKKRKKATIYS